MRTAEVEVKVAGKYACFTRPEFKVERVSYSVMTPAAARGLLEAIYWKPEFRYRIQEIGVLMVGRQMSILRNELSRVQTPPSKNKGKKGQGGPFAIEDEGVRQQRMSLVLKDVAYRIKALICVKDGEKDPPPKHFECFYRRVDRGQCHHTPYMGVREFPASFERATGEERPASKLTLPIGTMLFDTAYVRDERSKELKFVHHGADGHTEVWGRAVRLMFDATITDSILHIPQHKYEELEALENGHVAPLG